jgi:hypothetical protein
MIRCKHLSNNNPVSTQNGGAIVKSINKKSKLEIIRQKILDTFPPDLVQILRDNDLFD